MDEKRVKFVNSVSTLRSAKNLGITVVQGVNELVDNSVDAGARSVSIQVMGLGDGRTRVIVADDGCGIPESGGDGESGGINEALRMGKRIAHRVPSSRQPIGRYGFGLSLTASCLSNRTHAYSKTEEGDWRYSYLDIPELESEGARLPIESAGTPPKPMGELVADDGLEPGHAVLPKGFDLPESGTVVSLHDIHREDHMDVGGLVEDLRRTLSRTHRYSISAGLSIRLGAGSEEGRQLPVSDPLLQNPEAFETIRLGSEGEVYRVSIDFDGVDFRHEVEDPETGLPARVEITMINADVRRMRERLGLTRISNPRVLSKNFSEYGFNRACQGFCLVRGGREITHGQTLRLYTKNAPLNYFHGEVRFPACLDSWFGIEVNKSEFRLDGRLRDKIRQLCGTQIERYRRQTVKRLSSLRGAKEIVRSSSMEERSSALREIAERPDRGAAEREELLRRLEERKAEEIESVITTSEEAVNAAQRELSNARLTRDEEDELRAEKSLDRARKELERDRREVSNRFANDAFFRKFLKPLNSDEIYEWEDLEDEVWVTINTNSRFFMELYQRSSGNAEMESLLDLMIFSLALSEANKYHSPEMKSFWAQARRQISRISHVLLGTMSFEKTSTEAGGTFESVGEILARASKEAGIEPPRKLSSTSAPSGWFKELARELVGREGDSVRENVTMVLELAGIKPEADYFYDTGKVTKEGLIALADAVEHACSERSEGTSE